LIVPAPPIVAVVDFEVASAIMMLVFVLLHPWNVYKNCSMGGFTVMVILEPELYQLLAGFGLVIDPLLVATVT